MDSQVLIVFFLAGGILAWARYAGIYWLDFAGRVLLCASIIYFAVNILRSLYPLISGAGS